MGPNAAEEINSSTTTPLNQAGVRLSIGILVVGHEISGNTHQDVFAGAGIRVNTVFADGATSKLD